MEKKKILVVGPSDTGSKGGMATVIGDIRSSRLLQEQFDLELYSSFIDGSFPVRMAYCLLRYLRFLPICGKYDLFHIHMAAKGSFYRKRLYLRAAKARGKKVIVHIHGSEIMKFYRSLNAKKQKEFCDTLQAADLVLVLSDWWKAEFERECGLKNCAVLNNGIHTDTYAAACSDVAAHRNEFVVLGRLGERKGTYDLIEAVRRAAKQNPSLRILLAGDGEIERVRALVKEYGLEEQIEVVGWAGPEKKLELLRRSAALLLPSYNEGLPMAILEAMASGRAIVSTTVGAIPEVIGEENGILIAPGDTKALSEAILTLSGDPERLKRMSEANLLKVRRDYSIEGIHKKLLAYYRSVLGS